jgi:hypothetical protein
MDPHDILNDESVLELKRLALELKAHPSRINAPSLSFPEAWASVWKSAKGQPLQDKIRQKFGDITLIPLSDGSIGVTAAGKGPWGGVSTVEQGEVNVPHSVKSIREVMAKQNRELTALVQARQRASGLSFDECFREVLAERPDLKQGGSAGFFMTPSE